MAIRHRDRADDKPTPSAGPLLPARQAAKFSPKRRPRTGAAKRAKAANMRYSRREALALLATGATFAQLPNAALAQDLRRIRVGKAIDSSFPFSGVELGVKQGFWKKLGLNV